ncbi:MAG: roadblock/LC7 domain-containing protein [Candidatus Methanoperedens sp.]|nr:roadblock/LC7 domain-containing protein [Candidatus Methanoperedens sp.]
METIANMLEKILEEILSVGGVELCALVSKQGLLMVSREASPGFDNEAFAALTATLFMSAESTTMRLNKQKPKSIIVETNDKKLIIYEAGPNALIVVLVSNMGFIGLILNELKKAAEKTRNII